MEFKVEGFNGYNDYVYVCNPTKEELEKAIAIVMLEMKHKPTTKENIEKQIKIVQEQDLTEDREFLVENYEEITEILITNTKFDL